jgi:Phospholipase_D-nuclease N-terminal
VVIRLLLLAAVVLFVVLWVRAVIDLVRRADLGPGAKVAWAVGMLVLPFIGLLVYTMLRPSDAEVARRAQTR